jgi:hypothetical protein
MGVCVGETKKTLSYLVVLREFFFGKGGGVFYFTTMQKIYKVVTEWSGWKSTILYIFERRMIMFQ